MVIALSLQHKVFTTFCAGGAFDTVLEMKRTYLVLICSLLIAYIGEAESETHSLRKALKTKKVRDWQ